MKYKFLFGLALAGLLLTTPAMAGLIITFDENGNWDFDGIPNFTARQENGILTYKFGLAVEMIFTPGDLLLTEPGTTTQSDLLRFVTDAAGRLSISVFSDAAGHDLADGSMPNQLQANLLTVDETGLFGWPYSDAGPNGILYIPTQGQPGYAHNPFGQSLGITYQFISDVPEPTTLALLGIGIAGMTGYGRRRRKKATVC